MVFGTLAGDGAHQYIQKLSSSPQAGDKQIKRAFRKATDILNREDGANPYVLHDQLQDIMGENVGIVRTREDLETGLAKLETLKQEAKTVKAHGSSQYNPGWDEAISLDSLLIVSEAVARAALMREESRGAHTRLDFEGERDDWLKVNIVIRRITDEQMEVEKVLRPSPPPELAAIANAAIEDLEAGKVGTHS